MRESLISKRQQDEFERIKEQYLLYAAFVGAIISSIIFIIRVIFLIQENNFSQIIPLTILLVIILLLAFIRKIDFHLRLYAYVALLLIVGAISLFTSGINGDGRLYLFGAVVLVSLLSTRRSAVITSGISLVLLIVMATNAFLNIIPLNQATNPGKISDWLIGIATFLLILAIIWIITDGFLRRFVSSMEVEKTLANQLEDEKASRATLIHQQTEELSRRNAQLELASQIARDIAIETDTRTLLNKTVDLIKDRFGFYHVGIFVLDELKEYAVLRAATGEAGQKLLERKHKLRAGQEGIVGFTCGSGEARIALDVGSDAVHFRNPLLPETRSEMALPLKIGTHVIGALDVQSKLESAFTTEDIRILQSIADQLTVGIERTRLVEQLQTTINELTTSSSVYTEKAWGTLLKAPEFVSSFSISQEREEKNISEPPEVKEVLKKGETVIHHIKEGGLETTIVAVPVKVREQIIGVLNIHYASSTIDADTHDFINTVASRLALSLENARLLQDTQKRASTEHLVREITTRVQSYTSVDDILKATAGELGRSLGLSEVQIELHTPKK
jgi:GAF domain-containing protein